MAYKPKTWLEKLADKEGLPKTLSLEERFPCYNALHKMGMKAGDSVMLVNPREVTALMRQVPYGRLTPLEMRHSHTAKAAAQQDGLAVGHRAWFGWPVAAPDLPVPTGSLPSGQLIASAEDMGHYLIAQLNNGRYHDAQILSPASIAAMQRPAVTAASMGVEMGAYGMGWFVQQTPQGVRLWHNGQVPDYFAYMVLLPEQRRGLVLLTNTNQMMLNFALLGVGEGAAALLSGAKPDSFPLSVIPWLLRSFLLIPLLLMLDVFTTLRRAIGRQLANGRRPGVPHLREWRILPPTLLYLALALLAFILLLSNLRRFILLFMPDLFWLVLLCGGFALVWSLMRILFLMKQNIGSLS